MRNYPNISTGLGKFTPDLFDRLMVMLRTFELDPTNAKRLDQRQEQQQGRKTFVGAITHTGQISTNRFKYTVDERVPGNCDPDDPSATFGFISKEGGIQNMFALNTVELQNTADFAGPGIDLSADDFPSGMSLQAIETGTLAICHVLYDRNGKQCAVFTIANAVDGSCS
tara:strand:+ start:1766 stop:2272 length:507 start_codon:yes stop_codon:yes gene_type:complete